MQNPLGLKFEIVPQADPFKADGTLPVQVLFDGKPLAGAKWSMASMVIKRPASKPTDGKASVPVTAKGEQFIAVDYAPAAAGQENTSYSTSLRYELK